METILENLVEDRKYKGYYTMLLSINKVGFNSTGVMTLDEISNRFSIPVEELKLKIRN